MAVPPRPAIEVAARLRLRLRTPRRHGASLSVAGRYNWRYSLRRTARCQPSAASYRGWRYAAQAVSISGASSPLEVRLADLRASLSLATDLGTAFPLEKALRNALLAVGIGRELGMDHQTLSDTYYMAMLRFLGCSAFAHELAAAFGGDDNAFHSTFEASMSVGRMKL